MTYSSRPHWHYIKPDPDPGPEQLCERYLAHMLSLGYPVWLPTTSRPLFQFIETLLRWTQTIEKTHVWLHALRLIEILEYLRHEDPTFDTRHSTPRNPGTYFAVALMLSHKFYEDVDITQMSWVNIMSRDIPSISKQELSSWEHSLGQALEWNLTPASREEMARFKDMVYNIYFFGTSTTALLLRPPESITIQETHISGRPSRAIPGREVVKIEKPGTPITNCFPYETGRTYTVNQSTAPPTITPQSVLDAHYNSRVNTFRQATQVAVDYIQSHSSTSSNPLVPASTNHLLAAPAPRHAQGQYTTIRGAPLHTTPQSLLNTHHDASEAWYRSAIHSFMDEPYHSTFCNPAAPIARCTL